MLGATNTALLVIDMQRDFLDAGGYATSVGFNISRLRRAISPVACLLRAVRSAGMLIVHTREGHMPDLSDCPPAKLDRSQVLGAAIRSPAPWDGCSFAANTVTISSMSSNPNPARS
jgi:nicotinamidase-related amidase